MTSSPKNASDLAQFFAAHNCQPVEKPPVLQPTEPFLDHANRDLRRHFYMLRDVEGRNFFLRPDFTLPLAQAYALKPKPVRLCYDGSVFRFNAEDDHLIRRKQAGIEFFGPAPDHEIVLLTAEALQWAGLPKRGTAKLRLGDGGLFTALTEMLAIPEYWQRFLQFRFRRQQNHESGALTLPPASQFQTLPTDPDALKQWWQEQSIPAIGTRSAEEIAQRLAALHALSSSTRPRREEEALVEAFLNIEDRPLRALDKIAALIKKNGIDMDDRLNRMALYFDALAEGGADMDKARFATGFAGSDLGYYTGFLFSIEAGKTLLAAGGRYNGLLTALGVKGKAAQGAGAAIYLEETRTSPQAARNAQPVSGVQPAAGRLLVGLPSKGRIADSAYQWLAENGLDLDAKTNDRAFSLSLEGAGVELVFLPAAEIAHQLVHGQVHLGITGMDLVRECMPASGEGAPTMLAPLPFSHAKLTLAVPQCWVDVETADDLDEAASAFRRRHGRRMRIATKYPRLARSFFSQHGMMAYRLVESLGATENAPQQMVAEAVVDITSSGNSLKASGLKPLKQENGEMLVILSSQAVLYASPAAPWLTPAQKAAMRFVSELGLTNVVAGMIKRIVGF